MKSRCLKKPMLKVTSRNRYYANLNAIEISRIRIRLHSSSDFLGLQLTVLWAATSINIGRCTFSVAGPSINCSNLTLDFDQSFGKEFKSFMTEIMQCVCQQLMKCLICWLLEWWSFLIAPTSNVRWAKCMSATLRPVAIVMSVLSHSVIIYIVVIPSQRQQNMSDWSFTAAFAFQLACGANALLALHDRCRSSANILYLMLENKALAKFPTLPVGS